MPREFILRFDAAEIMGSEQALDEAMNTARAKSCSRKKQKFPKLIKQISTEVQLFFLDQPDMPLFFLVGKREDVSRAMFQLYPPLIGVL